MARALKTGLDYFPFDVNFLSSRKVRRIMRKHGPMAVTALMALLSVIYREQGYYLLWNEDICFDLSEMADTDMDKMHAIVADAIRAEFFDDEKFKKHGILTSKSIQEQYLVCTQKRKQVVIEQVYALVEKCSANDSSDGINSPEIEIQEGEIPVSEPEMLQRKEKEKEIESEVKEGGKPGEILVDGRWIPEYCLNKRTHNYGGLLYRLAEIRVREEKELDAILKLSNYGRIGHPVWSIISHSNWPKGNVIQLPGRFIIARLRKL
ncbi:DUF4373 domain-containing protein [Bacteroides sp. 51]|uniref:DUF4373 domain-containing protein n=1 Tax=Bacteroides sp. 51 TaxID=2302938 RepID=UPI0013D464F0|nr:DUF4373 domain-containing protein [Bacteroides sp. 51]